MYVKDEQISKKFLIDVKFSNTDSLFLQDDLYNIENIPKEFIKNFLCGLFLGAGSISNPDKNYHL